MNPRRHKFDHGRQARRGLSLIETAVSALLVGVLLVSALRTAGVAFKTQYQTSERVTAQLLANGLMWEILAQDYMEPGQSSSVMTRESGESGGARATYDDVDDYYGWSTSPPQNKDGEEMPGYAGWHQSVSVGWVNVDNIETVSSVETGAKRITVTIRRNDKILATRIAVKTNAP